MNTNINLKRRIMARIYFEYGKNAFLDYPDYFMLALFVVTAFLLVSIHNVLANLPKDNISNVFNFLIVAVRNTSLVIQLLLVGFFTRVVIGSSILIYKNKKTGQRWLAFLTSKFSRV
jgi:hypothetical protein